MSKLTTSQNNSSLKINTQKFENDNLFVVDFSLSKETFSSLRERITEQYLTNIEIPGFRKGNAPRDKAMAKADLPYLENLIWNEAITRNYTEADKMIRDELTIKNRALISIALSQDPDTIGDLDGGFKFRLNGYLLPDIDLKPLEKIEVKNPKITEITNRITVQEFITKEEANFVNTFNEYEETKDAASDNSRIVVDIVEKNLISNEIKETKDALIGLGLGQFPVEFEKNLLKSKAGDKKEFEISVFNKTIGQENPFAFTIDIKSIQAPKYKTIEDLFANSEFAIKNFGSKEKFNQETTLRYDRETENLIQDLKIKNIINYVVANTPKVQIEEDLATKESERIFDEINNNADPVKVFNDSKFPFVDTATTKSLKDEITKYVKGEFALSKILMVVYYQKISNKTSEEDLEQNVNEVLKDPTKYGYDKNIGRDQLKDQVFDIILRNKSLAYLMEITKFN